LRTATKYRLGSTRIPRVGSGVALRPRQNGGAAAPPCQNKKTRQIGKSNFDHPARFRFEMQETTLEVSFQIQIRNFEFENKQMLVTSAGTVHLISFSSTMR
jgi:hypothetical protein